MTPRVAKPCRFFQGTRRASRLISTIFAKNIGPRHQDGPIFLNKEAFNQEALAFITPSYLTIPSSFELFKNRTLNQINRPCLFKAIAQLNYHNLKQCCMLTWMKEKRLIIDKKLILRDNNFFKLVISDLSVTNILLSTVKTYYLTKRYVNFKYEKKG